MKKFTLLLGVLLAFNSFYAQENIEVKKDSINLNESIPFDIVEKAPVFPGCEKYSFNDERKKCTIEGVQKLVWQKFDADIANELGLEPGKQKIITTFEIDTLGNVINIISKGPHPRLEQEAIRVISLMPKWIPGEEKEKAVKVKYSIPISFLVIEHSGREKKRNRK